MNIPFLKLNKSMFLNAILLLTLVGTTGLVYGQKSRVPEAPATDIDQCANGSLPAAPQPCVGARWVNGNIHETNSQWVENQFVPYRVVIQDVTSAAAGQVGAIQWDTTEGTQHALDYIGTYNASNPATPCQLAVCGVPTTFAIPLDPRVSGAGVTQIPGVFTIWGGEILGVGSNPAGGNNGLYVYEGPADYSGTSKAGLYITFRAFTEGATVVISWSGHISSRLDWGPLNSAIGLSGSPYHMRIFGGTGNQDRSMSVAGVIFPALFQVIKTVTTFNGGTVSEQIFAFSATNTFLNASDVPVPQFNLQDNGDNTDGTSDTQNGKVLNFVTPIRVEEQLTSGWSAADVDCIETDGGLGLGRVTGLTSGVGTANPLVLPFAQATLLEGAILTCTFSNLQSIPTAAPATLAGRVVGTNGRGIAGVRMTLTDLTNGERLIATTNTFGYYMFENLETTIVYSLNAKDRRVTFTDATRFFTLEEDNFDMNFYASN